MRQPLTQTCSWLIKTVNKIMSHTESQLPYTNCLEVEIRTSNQNQDQENPNNNLKSQNGYELQILKFLLCKYLLYP